MNHNIVELSMEEIGFVDGAGPEDAYDDGKADGYKVGEAIEDAVAAVGEAISDAIEWVGSFF